MTMMDWGVRIQWCSYVTYVLIMHRDRSLME
jgi:hypothetical protein